MLRTLTLLLAWVVAPCEAAIELDVAPDPIIQDESCRLTFRATGTVDGEPDFTTLEAAFDILGRNRQSSIKWLNGRSEQTTTWVLNAMPRAAGRIEIPAIAFGSERSPARTVDVVSRPLAGQRPADDILLEVEASPRHPYVQQQVIYTVRLLHRVELNSSRFSALTTSADAIVKPLGSGRQYVAQVDGRSFDAFEQRYAVFPQHSGDLTINPLVLTTQVVSGTRGFFDPFAQTMTTRRIESQALSLEVKPVPAAFPAGAAWLPARRLRLHEEWEPDVNAVELGAPLARTLFLWADGLVAGQLPTLALAPPTGIKVYPDQPQSNEQDTATGFTAVLQQRYALVASSGGEARFPAIEIPWWNIETDRLETARVPERVLTVKGAPPPPAPVAAPAAATTAAATPVATPATTRPIASWPAALLAAGWALTALAWWWQSRRRRAAATSHIDSPRPDSPEARRALAAACRADDAAAAADALLAWAAARGFEPPVHALGSLARHVSASLAREIRALERQRYGRDGGRWEGAGLWQAFEQEPRRTPARARSAAPPPLPPLGRAGLP